MRWSFFGVPVIRVVRTIQKTVEIPQMQYVDRVVGVRGRNAETGDTRHPNCPAHDRNAADSAQ